MSREFIYRTAILFVVQTLLHLLFVLSLAYAEASDASGQVIRIVSTGDVVAAYSATSRLTMCSPAASTT